MPRRWLGGASCPSIESAMLFKLDENIDPYLAGFLRDLGLECSSVPEEAMSGWEDDRLFEAVRSEMRCLVTADLDFSNATVYPPQDSGGVVVLRHPSPSRTSTKSLLLELVELLKDND